MGKKSLNSRKLDGQDGANAQENGQTYDPRDYFDCFSDIKSFKCNLQNYEKSV